MKQSGQHDDLAGFTPVPVDIIPIAALADHVGQTDLDQLLTYLAPSFQSSRQTVADR